jgi:uncharacterized surface protein with fasciclin (FAS1) repeats
MAATADCEVAAMKLSSPLLASVTFALALAAGPSFAQELVLPEDPPADAENPNVAGATMDRNASALTNLGNSPDHARLVQAIEAAGLSGAINAIGPLTIFAPTDSAFSSTTYDDLDELLKPENRGRLGALLRYHVVAGLYDRATLDARIEAGGGTGNLDTISGGTLQVRRSGGEYTITDATNHTARITVADVYQRNGVVQVIDQVLMPDTPQ